MERSALSAIAIGVGAAAGAASADFVAGRVPVTATGFPAPSKVISSPDWPDFTTKS